MKKIYVVLLIPIVSILIIMNGSFAKDTSNNKIKAGSENIQKPKNLNECFIELNKIIKPKDLKTFKKSNEKELSLYHLGLGVWIRNNWIRPKNSPLANYFAKMGITHPDDMSSIILKSFHRHLNNKDIKLKEQVRYYRDYWNKK